MRKQYPAVLAGIGSNQIDVAFPDFPGCVTVAASIDEAFVAASEVLAFHMQSMLEDDDPIPPGGDDAMLLDMVRDYEDEGHRVVIATVTVEIPESRTRRINITLPEFVVQAADRWARAHGESRSSLLALAAMDYIKRHG